MTTIEIIDYLKAMEKAEITDSYIINNSKQSLWFVSETFYYLWDDDILVGEYRIRNYLTDALRTGAGHIGYIIKKDFRGRGYGTKGLALALELARKIVPEDEIYLRVLKNNIPFFKAICNNDAYIANEDDTHFLMIIKK